MVHTASRKLVLGRHARSSHERFLARSSHDRVLEAKRASKCCSKPQRFSTKDAASLTENPLIARRKCKRGGLSAWHANQRPQKDNSVGRNRVLSFFLGHEECDRRFKFSITGKGSRKNNERFARRIMKATILSWLIDTGVVQENAEVYSTDERSKQIRNRGILKKDGILCFCCRKVFPVGKFHLHGARICTKPYENIFLADTKASLLFYMVEAWNSPGESQTYGFNAIETTGDLYDDVCMVCADGGDLMCCEGCSSTYHQACMELEDVPEDSWYCPYCVCKFCADPSHALDHLLTCPQCEKRYHWECHKIKEQGLDLNSIPVAPFCEQSCKEVFDELQNTMVGQSHELDAGYSWTILHQMDGNEFDEPINDNYTRIMGHSKLAVARKLMEECFEPIQDRHTRVQVIPSVVYNCGSNFRRVSFEGFYMAVLEKDEELLCVASLRIHGKRFAEMPFITTNEAYRCRGMCRKLMNAIESWLCRLRVKDLVIPSVPEKSGFWISKYGFRHLSIGIKYELTQHSTVMFHDSVVLRKRILPLSSS